MPARRRVQPVTVSQTVRTVVCAACGTALRVVPPQTARAALQAHVDDVGHTEDDYSSASRATSSAGRAVAIRA